jgi:hypothetical protein
MPTFDINMEALFIQLYNTSSSRTLILLFTNSSDGEEMRNFPLTEKFPSGTLMKKLASLRRVCKIRRQNS